MRNLFQEGQVLWMPAVLVVADKRAERRTAKRPVLIFVNLFEKSTLIELSGSFEILAQIVFGNVHDSDL